VLYQIWQINIFVSSTNDLFLLLSFGSNGQLFSRVAPELSSQVTNGEHVNIANSRYFYRPDIVFISSKPTGGLTELDNSSIYE